MCKKVIVAVVLMGLTALTAGAVDITSNLIAYYKLNEATGAGTAQDSSPNNFPGMPQNFVASPWVAGKIDGAAQFTSANTTAIVMANNLIERSVVTTAAWFKTTTSGVVVGYQGGLFPAITGGYVPSIYVGLDGLLRGEYWSGAVAPITSAVPVNDGVWHHAALVCDGANQRLYLDGVALPGSLGPVSFYGGVNEQIGTGYSGGWPSTPGGYFHFTGSIDDVRIYSRALSAADILALVSFADTPEVANIKAVSATQVSVLFSTPVTSASANNPANYGINDSIAISGAALQADGRTVLLTTSAMQSQVYYTATFNNIVGLNTGNTIAAGTNAIFLLNPSVLVGTNLVAYYKLDETSGTIASDSSGTGNNGTLLSTSTPQPWALGAPRDGGLLFDGVNDYVDCGNNASVQVGSGGTPNGTIACWVKATAQSGGYHGIIVKQNAYSLFLSGNNLVTYDWTFGERFNSGVNLGDSQWHHVALTFQNGVANGSTMYIDGTPRGSFLLNNANQSIPLQLGYANCCSQNLDGVIDDARVYSRALTAAEILTLANGLPRVSISTPDTVAGEPSVNIAKFTISRTGSTAAALAVPIALSGVAISGTDYNLTYGSGPQAGLPAVSPISIPIGAASVDLVVTPIDDMLGEGTEDVILTFGATTAVYDRIAPTSARITILDDEPVVSLIASAPNASEVGPVDGQFTLTRSNNTVVGLTVTYTISGTAVNGTDYATITGTATFSPGQTTVQIPISVIGDTLIELDEDVTITLVAGAYLLSGPNAATVIIADKPTVTIVATDPNAFEVGQDPGVFTLTRSGSTALPLTLPLVISGTGVPNVDYVAFSTSVTFAVGQSTATVTVTPIDDLVLRTNTTVVATIVTNNNFLADPPGNATVNITTDPEIFNTSSAATIMPDPAVAGQAITFTGAVTIVTNWQWNFGDGSSATGAQVTHTFTQPGIYIVFVNATLPDGTISVANFSVFVGTSLITGGGTAPSTSPIGGILIGGGSSSRLGSGKLNVRFSSKQVTFSGKINGLNFDPAMSQAALQGRPSSLKIGTGAKQQIYAFSPNGSGRASADGLPKLQLSLKQHRFSFTATSKGTGLFDYLQSIGLTQGSTQLDVPVTGQFADHSYIALLFRFTLRSSGDAVKGQAK